MNALRTALCSLRQRLRASIYRRNKSFIAISALMVAPLLHAQSDAPIKHANVTCTTIDVPGAGVSGAYGINLAGDVVGYYGQSGSSDKHGFLFSNGNFTFLDYPGSPSTIATSINDSGLIVGYTGTFYLKGFLYDQATYTALRDGSDTATVPYGINNQGIIVGGAGTPYTTKGFERQGGHYKTVSFPGQNVYASADGINTTGQIVGHTDYDAYLFSGGKFKKIDYPGATMTEATGINDAGVIVGWYEQGPPYAFYGFALVKGKFSSLTCPGATATFISGINALGQIVGQYELSDTSLHGFEADSIVGALNF